MKIATIDRGFNPVSDVLSHAKVGAHFHPKSKIIPLIFLNTPEDKTKMHFILEVNFKTTHFFFLGLTASHMIID